jgi:hypothetical protein
MFPDLWFDGLYYMIPLGDMFRSLDAVSFGYIVLDFIYSD